MLRRSSPIMRPLSCSHSSARRRAASSESAMARDRKSRRLRFCASLRFMARCTRAGDQGQAQVRGPIEAQHPCCALALRRACVGSHQHVLDALIAVENTLELRRNETLVTRSG